MANRYSKLSTSTFNPLTMQEIMAVPMAMQQQHDALQAEADKASLLEAQYGSADKEGAEARVSELRSKANNISSSLGDKGFNRSLLRDFTALKKETELEYGKNGYLGNVQKNAVAQSKFVNDLATDKARQAGWSPQEAQQWAQEQVRDFGPTQNDDGTYNSFQGRELVTKFEGEDELLDEAIERVAETVDEKTIAQIRVGGISSLERAYRERTISRVDYNSLMDSMLTSASTNPDLIRSLNQEAEMYGIENPLDFGKFSVKNVPVFDKKGNPVMKGGKQVTRPEREFTPGKSRFGQKMSGFGRAAEYVNPKDAIIINTDPAAKAAYDAGLDAASSAGMVNITNGEANSVTAKTFDIDMELVTAGKQEAKIFKSQADQLYKKLEAGGATPEQIKGDKEWQRLNSNYKKSYARYSNTEKRLDYVSKQADTKLTSDQRSRLDFQKLINEKYSGHLTDKVDIDGKNTIDFERILFEEYGETIIDYSDPENVTPGDHDPKEVSSTGWKSQGSRQKMALKILEQKAGLENTVYKGDVMHNSNHGFDYQQSELKDTRTDLRNEYLTANPTAEYFNVFDGSGAGKNYSDLGGRNEIITENFNPVSAEQAYNRGMLQDDEEYQELITGLTEGEVPEIQVSLTDGQSDDGTFFNNLIVTTSKGTGSFQILDASNNGARRDLFESFVNGGNSDQRAIGMQGLANLDHMANIKQSGFGKQPDGIVTMKVGDTNFEATYKKDDTGEFYAVSIEGPNGPISISDQPIYSRADLSLKMAKAATEIQAQKAKESDPDYDASADTDVVTSEVSPSVSAILNGKTTVQEIEDNSFVSMEDVNFLMNAQNGVSFVEGYGGTQVVPNEDPNAAVQAEIASDMSQATPEVSTPDDMQMYNDPDADPIADPIDNTADPKPATEVTPVKKGDEFTMGDNTVTITDPYGIRTFKGREGKHSTGIDYKTSSGNVVALTDGVIKEVKLQGDGSVMTPSQGSAAGYYIIVEQSDGTMAQYMHLDPMTPEEMKSLVGKPISKGEEVWGYSTGSGSMTGPHVKYRQYKKGTRAKTNHMDPSALFE
jgi:murein DD-endopeptidase MepM/ murein hydrolase activator NlpD